MSVAIFKKVSLFGLIAHKAAILQQLQVLGCVHLSTISKQTEAAFVPEEKALAKEIKHALRYLADSPRQANQRKSREGFHPEQLVQEILQNQQELLDSIDRRDFLDNRIKALTVWGNFHFPTKKENQDYLLWFYQVPHNSVKLLSQNLIIQEISRDNLFVYCVVLAKEEPTISEIPFPRVHTGSVPLKMLLKEREDIEDRIDILEEKRRFYTRFRYLLTCEIANFIDQDLLLKASKQLRDEENFFVLQGFVPEKKVAVLAKFCELNEIGLVLEEVKSEDFPPTMLETSEILKGGAHLVNFYQTPGYTDIDPSRMVFFSFSLFFAMIVADAGFGLVIALITLFLWRKLGKYHGKKWLRPLLVSVSLSTILYGTLIGSYFGFAPPVGGWLAKLKVLNIQDFKTMMIIALVVGCLHICLGIVLRLAHGQNKYQKMQLGGWLLLVLAGMVLGWAVMENNQTWIEIMLGVEAFSLLLIMFFASDLPVTNIQSFFKRILAGLIAVTNLTSLFGDILSYIRLFALGLAGSSLAFTFNTIAAKISQTALNGHGWVIGLLILLFGQILNFALSLLGGVVHGLRLNYIEFFKWSLEKEGTPYTPLKKQEIFYE